MIEQPLFRVPAAQNDRAGVPRVVMQIPVFVGPHDVVHAERPRAPPQRGLVRFAGVGVEQPPAAHVHLGAVGGHDVQVWGALGAGDEPGGNRRARKQLGDDAPEQVDHGESLPGHARAVECCQWGSRVRKLRLVGRLTTGFRYTTRSVVTSESVAPQLSGAENETTDRMDQPDRRHPSPDLRDHPYRLALSYDGPFL